MSTLVQVALKQAMGDRLIGFFASAVIDSMLLGIVIVQIISYCTRYARTDKKHIVGLVLLAVASTIIATIFSLMWVNHLFVWNFGDYIPFTEIIWVVRDFAIGMATIAIVQGFYVDRACRLYRHWWPATVLGPFAAATLSLGIAALWNLADRYDRMTPDVYADPSIAVLMYTWLGFVFSTDLLITAIVAYGLRRVKTGWRHTDSRLHRLIIRLFETQTPAVISSAATLTAWRSRYDIALIFISIQSKIYTIGLLTTLNFRADITSDTSAGTYSSRHVPTSSHAMGILSRGQVGMEDKRQGSVDEEQSEFASTTGLHGQGH